LLALRAQMDSASMNLETDSGVKIVNVTEDDLRKLFADDLGFGEFLILSESETHFIQAHAIAEPGLPGKYQKPYVVEHRDGAPGIVLQATFPVEKPLVLDFFLDYLRGGKIWHAARQWREVRFGAQ
jgi:hypothetical protein